MSIIPNYLALYNLSQIEADILIVSDLTATTGTIYTLFSSTGTITTLNSTTGNITTHIGNIWQGTSTTSDMRIGSVADTGGVISVYKTMSLLKNLNINTSNGAIYCSNFFGWNGSADITFAQSVILATNKNLTLQGTGAISLSTGNISTGGQILSNVFRANTPASSVSLFDNSTAQINFGNALSGTLIVVKQGLYMDAQNILIVGASNKITTPNITLSGTQTASKLLLTDASKNVVSSLYTDTDFARLTAVNIFTNNNTIQGSLSCDNIRSIAPHTANVSLFPTTTGRIELGLSVGGGDLSIRTNTILFADKYLEITGTGYLVLPSAVGNANSFIRCEKYNTWGVVNPVSLFITTTGLITLGNIAGTLTINSTTTFSNSMIMDVNKNITLSGSGKITTPNILVSGLTASKLVKTDASDNLVSSLYDETTLPVSTPTQTALNLKANIDNPTFTTKITTPVITFNGAQTASKLLLTDASKNIVSSIYDETTLPVSTPTQTALNLKANINAPVFTTSIGLTSGNLTISSGKILNNTYTGLTTSATIEIGEVGDTGLIRTRKDLYIGSTPFGSNKGIFCNYFDTLANTDTINFAATQASGNINIQPSAIGGNVVIGNSTAASDLGLLSINKNTGFAGGKNLTLSSTSIFKSDNIYSNAISFSPSIYPDTTTGTITIGGALSSGSINLGVIGMTGGISCNSNVNIGTSAANKGLSCNFYASFTNSSIVQFCRNLISGELRIAPEITSGQITIGHTTPASDTGTLVINRNTTMATNKNLTLQGTGLIACNTYNATSISSTLEFGKSNTSGNIFIGSALTSGSITLGRSLMSGGFIYCYGDLLIGTGATPKKMLCNTIESFDPANNVSLFSNTTTGSITIAGGITTGSIIIGNSGAGGSGTLTSWKNFTMGSVLFNIKCNSYNAFSATNTLSIGSNTTTGGIEIGSLGMSSGIFSYADITINRTLGVNNRNCFINMGYGNATTPTLFQSNALLQNKYFTTTMWANAPTSEWHCIESDCGGEASAFVQNGDTTMIINPGDQSAFWWLDEDTIQASAGSTTYMWQGWKISTAGVFTISSDRRLKRDITPIVDVDILDKLSLIEMVNYKWKAPSEDRYFKNGVERRKYKEVHTGYIAQDVRKIFPECVERENEESYWTIKREDITSKFNLGVQELIKRDKEKQIQIDAQKVIIDDLTARLARLEQLILNA